MNKRPIRVWVIVAMLILIGGTGLFVTVYLITKPEIAGEIGMSSGELLFAAISPTLLIVSAILYFLGRKYSQYFLLVMTLLHFGTIAGQNAYLLFLGGEFFAGSASKFTANIIRSCSEMALVVWIVSSKKARDFVANT